MSHPATPDLSSPISESYWVLPGQFLAGEYPGGHFSHDSTRARMESFIKAGFDTFIDLTEEGEANPYEPILREQAAIHNLPVEYMRFGIGDFGLPSVDGMRNVLKALDDAIIRGRKVYLHCYGGIGRTGTTVGCYLVQHGRSGEQALAQLAEWWQTVPKHVRFPRSPETRAQEDFIRNWLKQP